ncbi:phage terminase large subunit family protein [Escherichia coli]|nr:phage terminase large subunit family protein [Escherichia coli]
MGFSSARNLGRDISAGFSPPRRMPISEAVKKFMRVPKGAGNSVPWDPELTPYIIEPMNCLASREYDAVIFVGPARTGKTIGLIDGWIVYTHSASASSTDLGTKTTSSFDYGTKSTNNTGAHTHSLSGSTNAAGNHSHRDGRRFNPSVFKDTYQYGYTSSGQNTWGVQGSVGMSTGWLANTSTDGNHSHSLSGTAASAGAHAHTVGIGAHTHSVAIGSHGHTITVNAAGNAENTVKNIAFNYIVRLA